MTRIDDLTKGGMGALASRLTRCTARISLVLLLATAACADDASQALPSAPVAAAEGTGDPVAASAIAFAAEVNDVSQIFTILPDGSGMRPLTKGSYPSAKPAWSPDRRRIAYVRSDRTGQSAVYVMDAHGGKGRRLTGPEFLHVGEPSWSPDGRTIVLTASAAGQRPDVYVIPVAGNVAPTRLTNDTLFDIQPVFSPDGSRIAVTRYTSVTPPNVHIMNADGTNLHQFTFCPSTCQFPSWSPDGRNFAYQQQDSLFVIPLGTGAGPSGIAGGLTYLARPRWSPDGTELVFVGHDGIMADLFAVPATGGTARRITLSAVEERAPSWAN